MPILPKLIYRLNVIPVQIQAEVFGDLDKLILKFIWMAEELEAKTLLKKNKVRGITVSSFKTLSYSNKKRVELLKSYTQVKETEQNPGIDPHKYGYFLFDKNVKAIQWRKCSSFSK